MPADNPQCGNEFRGECNSKDFGSTNPKCSDVTSSSNRPLWILLFLSLSFFCDLARFMAFIPDLMLSFFLFGRLDLTRLRRDFFVFSSTVYSVILSIIIIITSNGKYTISNMYTFIFLHCLIIGFKEISMFRSAALFCPVVSELINLSVNNLSLALLYSRKTRRCVCPRVTECSEAWPSSLTHFTPECQRHNFTFTVKRDGHSIGKISSLLRLGVESYTQRS